MAELVPSPIVAPAGDRSRAWVAAPAVTTTVHGWKHSFAVTTNVNVFETEVAPAVVCGTVAGGVGGEVGGGTGARVLGTVGEIVARGVVGAAVGAGLTAGLVAGGEVAARLVVVAGAGFAGTGVVGPDGAPAVAGNADVGAAVSPGRVERGDTASRGTSVPVDAAGSAIRAGPSSADNRPATHHTPSAPASTAATATGTSTTPHDHDRAANCRSSRGLISNGP